MDSSAGWVSSSSWLLGKTSLWTWGYKSLFQTLLSVLLGVYSEMGFLEYFFFYLFIYFFWGATIVFSVVATSFCVPTYSIQGFWFFLHSHPHLSFFSFFDSEPSNGCEVVPHCGLDLHFCNDEWCWVSFHVLIGNLYISFGELSMHVASMISHDRICIDSSKPTGINSVI